MTRSRRKRNVPHPVAETRKQRRAAPGRHFDPDGVDRKVRKRSEASLHGSMSRVPGTNGSWPAHGVDGVNPPKPPAICALFEDLMDAAELPVAIFGQYPKSFLRKIVRPLLGCERHEVLHVCSGALPPGEGIRVDIRSESRPDILADGRRLPLPDNSVVAALIDPPYTRQYAQDLYGVEYPRPSHLLAEAARVVRPCGRIGFVHYLVPMPPPGCQYVVTKGLSTGFGFPMRALTVFQKDQDSLFETKT